MHIILIVLVVYRACPQKFIVCQIADLPFQAVGRESAESPQSVALESPRSNQASAWEGPPTKMLTRTFLCLLRNTVFRSFTEMFLAIFQHVRPEDSYAKSTPPFVEVRPIHNLALPLQLHMQEAHAYVPLSIARHYLPVFYGDVPRYFSEHGPRERRSDLRAANFPESFSRKATGPSHTMYGTITSCHFCRDCQQKQNVYDTEKQ